MPLFREHGSLRGVHEAARMLGLVHTALPKPLPPLGAAARTAIARALAALDDQER